MEYNAGTNTSYIVIAPLLNHIEVYQINGSNLLGKDKFRV